MLFQNQKTLLSILPFMLMLNVACSKNDSQHIEGTLLTSCNDETPIGGIQVEIHYLEKGVPGFGGVTGRNFTYSTTTDAKGHFKFEFEEESWNLGDAGTYGAELIVEGRNTILNGITSADSDLGSIFRYPPKYTDVVAIVSASGLFPDDTVYVNNEVVGVGNFNDFKDTFNVSIFYFDSQPNFGQLPTTGLSWRIVNPDTTQPAETVNFMLTNRCQKTASLTLDISR